MVIGKTNIPPPTMTTKTDVNILNRGILDGPNSVSAPDMTWNVSPHPIPTAPGNVL